MMKKYPIDFVKDFTKYVSADQLGIPKDEFNRAFNLVKKWRGKELTLLELEQNIEELDEVIFDGQTITVYNWYNE